jgi:predicted transcriptional regulator
MRYAPCLLEMRNYIRILRTSRDPVKDKDIMIANVACCTPEHTVRQAAEIMGQARPRRIAIVESVANLKPIGVITDRHITWRVVATGKSAAQTSVRDAMLSDL